jgi:hypothetical protein
MPGVLAMRGRCVLVRTAGVGDPEDYRHSLMLVDTQKLLFCAEFSGCFVYYSDLVNIENRMLSPPFFLLLKNFKAQTVLRTVDERPKMCENIGVQATDDYLKGYYTMNLQKTMDSLKANGFAVSYFETAEEAARHVAGQLKGKTVAIGGSTTCDQIGIYDMLTADNKVLWHWKDKTHRDRYGEFTAYMCSVNALAETGEFVNIDGSGNRLA